MEQVKTKKRLCPGSGRAADIRPEDEAVDIISGEVLHLCPVCGKGWSRNTLQDWSDLPIPRHFVQMVVSEWDGKPGSQVPSRYHSPRIEMWVDERRVGHGLVVTLKDGFTFESGRHVAMRSFDQINEAVEAVAASDHCYCPDCNQRIVAVRS